MDNLGDLGEGGRIIVKCILTEVGYEGVDWIQDRGRWRALLHTVMILLVGQLVD
jgi:hypothetical protein